MDFLFHSTSLCVFPLTNITLSSYLVNWSSTNITKIPNGERVSSVKLFSHFRLFATPRTVACQASLSKPTPRVYPNSCPFSWWCHPTISSYVDPLSSHLQSFPASGTFQKSQFFASGGQGIAVSASASVLPMSIQDWFPLGWTSLISLQTKGLWRVFSNTTFQKHQFFSAQPSLHSNSCIHIGLLESFI